MIYRFLFKTSIRILNFLGYTIVYNRYNNPDGSTLYMYCCQIHAREGLDLLKKQLEEIHLHETEVNFKLEY